MQIPGLPQVSTPRPAAASDVAGAVAGVAHEAPAPHADGARPLFSPDPQPHDASGALLRLNLPLSDTNVEAAQRMLGLGVPLTSQNLATLSRLLTERPYVGAQLATLREALRLLAADAPSRASLSASLLQVLDEMPALLDGLRLDPRSAFTTAQLEQMAWQAGVGSMPHGEGDKPDLAGRLRDLRTGLEQAPDRTPLMRAAAERLGDVEHTLSAMRLVNAGAMAEQGCAYVQVPLTPSAETAEARFQYHVDAQGRPVVDGENAILELRVPTETLGDVHWRIEVQDGGVTLDASVASEEARAAVAAHLPALMARVEALGYRVAVPTCFPRAKSEQADDTGARMPAPTVARVDLEA